MILAESLFTKFVHDYFHKTSLGGFRINFNIIRHSCWEYQDFQYCFTIAVRSGLANHSDQKHDHRTGTHCKFNFDTKFCNDKITQSSEVKLMDLRFPIWKRVPSNDGRSH